MCNFTYRGSLLHKIAIRRNGNKEYYVGYSSNNITKYSNIVEMTQRYTHWLVLRFISRKIKKNAPFNHGNKKIPQINWKIKKLPHVLKYSTQHIYTSSVSGCGDSQRKFGEHDATYSTPHNRCWQFRVQAA